ncbi:putative glycosyl hydrolase [Aspergillus stella-maris]|uniref:putative glycosyl hydrolase n=1 Tax=Aspergillus stella-maris TaxID=1810926 RepID=UPI003CCE2F3A
MALENPGDRMVVPGWHIVNSANVQTTVLELSRPSTADVTNWYRVGARATVLGGLVQANVYDENDLFYSDHLSKLPRSLFKDPWLYREEVLLPSLGVDQHIFLIVHGISSKADIVVNGEIVAYSNVQKGSYAGRSYDISRRVRPGTNCLLIQAYPTNYNRDLAVGWNDWNPHPPDSGMGVWRNVELQLTGPVSLSYPSVRTPWVVSGLPTAFSARIVVDVNLTNHSLTPRDVRILCRLHIPNTEEVVEFSQTVLVPMKSASHVTLTTTLEESQIHLWWPAAWGAQPLYEFSLTAFVAGDVVSDKTPTVTFGIRSVTSDLNEHDDRQFCVNGLPFQVRGAGYAPDIFLRFDIARVRKIFLYAIDMGLNTIRLEGKQEHPELYDLADRMGLMILPGWECCDKWESWDHVENADGRKWTGGDYEVAAASMLHEAQMMQAHPCILGFLIGSDYWPDDRATRIYLDVFQRVSWPNPVICSASMRGHPEQLEPSGMKMDGPYDWVPPNYWYGSKYGAASGFMSEQGSGVGTPAMGSLQRFLTNKEQESLWIRPNARHYHMGTANSPFNTRTIYSSALNVRYDPPVSCEAYVYKAQLTDYEATRAQFEAFSIRQSDGRPATGVIYWMLNSAWPSLHWQLFDYYLQPGGAYFGAKVGARAEHVALDYATNTIYIINHCRVREGLRRVAWHLVDADGKSLCNGESEIRTLPLTSQRISHIPELDDLDDVGFLQLILYGASDESLSRNVYWLRAQRDILDWDNSNWYTTPVTSYANLSRLDNLQPAAVDALFISSQRVASGLQIHIQLKNLTKAPAFFLQLTMFDANNQQVAPIFWSDNCITLLPLEAIKISVEVDTGNLDSFEWTVEMVGSNTPNRIVRPGDIGHPENPIIV